MAYSSFIAATYFTGEIFIPNAATDTQLTQAITQYEKEILINLLGYKLYKALIADCAGVTGLPVTQIYIDLVNGAEFTHTFDGEEYTLKWEGLKNTALVSLIAYYVFYEFVRRDATRYKGTGITMAPKGKDWERVSPMKKLCYVWERMRTLYGIIPPEYKSNYPNPVKYTEFDDVFDMEPSAFNFLYANQTNYPDWVFTPLWNLNSFGI